MAKKGKYFYGYARNVSVGIAAVSAGSTTEDAVFVAPCRCKIVRVGIVPSSAITGADTNYMTLGFKNKGQDGTGTDVIAQKAFTSGVNASAFAFTDLGELSHNVLNEGEVVTFFKSEAGTGANMPDLLAVIEYVRI